MRELELIECLERVLAIDPSRVPARQRVVRWIGDDAAVVRSAGYTVTSVDTAVDGVHFRWGELTPEEVGHRALASALSDLAAMGARPGECYLALSLPRGMTVEDAVAVARGAQGVAARHGATTIGGDVTSSAVLTVTVTVVGRVRDPGQVVGRDGARAGDLVAVTGALGGAGAGLALVEGRAAADTLDASVRSQLHRRYARPEPRLAEGAAFSELGATGLIDLSDGLATDAGHVGRRSGVELALSLGTLPLDAGVAEVAAEMGLEPGVLAATAGDDYELCACVPAAAREMLQAEWRARGLAALTWIGRVADGPAGVRFVDAAGVTVPGELSGYEHSG